MNFECLAELAKEYQYEEIQIIGRDVVSQGKQIYLIAMTRREDQAELSMLLYREKKPEEQRNSIGSECELNRELNRELMKCNMSEGFMSLKTLNINGTVLECREAHAGELSTSDLDSMLLLAKLAEAGWQMPEDHRFFRETWERIELRRIKLQCPCKQLPDWKNAKLKAVWYSSFRRHLIEKPARLTIGGAKDQKYVTQIAFTIQNANGVLQDGICYINNVRLENPWEEIDRNEADPEYRKKMLKYMTPEEFAVMQRDSCDAMEHICPRGMYFIAVEYESTLDLDLKFYLSEYLDSEPDRSGRGVAVLFGTKGEEEQGIHGLKLRSSLIQSPVAADVREVSAELFEAHEVLPESEEEWLPEQPLGCKESNHAATGRF